MLSRPVLGEPRMPQATPATSGGTNSGIMLAPAMKPLKGVLVRTTIHEKASPITTARIGAAAAGGERIEEGEVDVLVAQHVEEMLDRRLEVAEPVDHRIGIAERAEHQHQQRVDHQEGQDEQQRADPQRRGQPSRRGRGFARCRQGCSTRRRQRYHSSQCVRRSCLRLLHSLCNRSPSCISDATLC